VQVDDDEDGAAAAVGTSSSETSNGRRVGRKGGAARQGALPAGRVGWAPAADDHHNMKESKHP
jgi:hypothetical protein